MLRSAALLTSLVPKSLRATHGPRKKRTFRNADAALHCARLWLEAVLAEGKANKFRPQLAGFFSHEPKSGNEHALLHTLQNALQAWHADGDWKAHRAAVAEQLAQGTPRPDARKGLPG